jgi:AraC-like DNA-binding protein
MNSKKLKNNSESAFTRHAIERTREAAGIILADLRKHYSIPRIAKKTGLNERTLQDCFKHLYGKPIFVYGQEARLEHGRKLLLDSDLSIQSIAEECGYPEQSNFGAAFKKKYGVAPGGWRRENGSGYT